MSESPFLLLFVDVNFIYNIKKQETKNI